MVSHSKASRHLAHVNFCVECLLDMNIWGGSPLVLLFFSDSLQDAFGSSLKHQYLLAVNFRPLQLFCPGLARKLPHQNVLIIEEAMSSVSRWIDAISFTSILLKHGE